MLPAVFAREKSCGNKSPVCNIATPHWLSILQQLCLVTQGGLIFEHLPTGRRADSVAAKEHIADCGGTVHEFELDGPRFKLRVLIQAFAEMRDPWGKMFHEYIEEICSVEVYRCICIESQYTNGNPT